jgi:AcrR family transcriptional regulator
LDEVSARVLEQMRPAHYVDPQAPWQQRKSQEMRVRILECTMTCLVAKGYSALSTNDIVQMAKVSRGAMHHHFPSRDRLISALIEHVFYKRMENFLRDYVEMLRVKGEAADVESASDTYWASVKTPEYAAYLELAIAARSDEELNRAFVPAARQYDRVWATEMLRYFPQWKEHKAALELANDLAMVAYMGLLVHEPIFGDATRIDRIRGLLTDIVRKLQIGTIKP